MRSLLLALFSGLSASLSAMLAPAAAEPLFLRIRPNGPPPVEAGSATDEAARARASREAVWARAERRARIAIASVCAGCMKPMPPPAALAPRPERPETDLSASSIGPNALESGTDPVPAESIPPALLAQAGDP